MFFDYEKMYELKEKGKAWALIKKLVERSSSENTNLDMKIIEELLDNSNNDKIADEIIDCIQSKKPIQYYAGYSYIDGKKILLNSDVLVPGPEMDYMIHLCKKYIKNGNKVMDLCCGSGVITCMLANEYKNTAFYASDLSKKALNVAERNFELYNITNVEKYCGDMYEMFEKNDIHDFDVIIANPPYCKTKDIEKLPLSLREYTPRMAIDGGEDGLKLHKRVIQCAPSYLKQGGYIILQNENGQTLQIKRILEDSGFEIQDIVKNHLEQERLIVGRLV